MKKLFTDKAFYRTLGTLAIPIVFQNLITSSLNLVDNLMIGTLGEVEIAAVGLANQFFFIFILSMTGINGAANVFMSQYWGKKDITHIKKFLGIDLTIGFFNSILFTLMALCFPHLIMRIFSNDPMVIEVGSKYLRVISISYLLTNVTLGFSTALRSTDQAKIPMFASLISLIANASLNWIFIFGHFGFPKMGVAGAALGTTIARTLEMSFILFNVYVKKNIVASKLSELKYNASLVKSYFKTGSPVIFNDIMWSVGISMYSIAYGIVGTHAVATMQIATTVNNLFNIFGMSLANAAAIIIGNKIGANDEETAIKYSYKIAILAPLIGVVIGAIVFFLTPQILKLFNITHGTYNYAKNILKIMAFITPLRFFNIVMIIGVFRGGGDVVFSIKVELLAVWLVAVPLAFIGAALLHVDIITLYILVTLEEACKFFFEIPRLKSNKWVRNVINSVSV